MSLKKPKRQPKSRAEEVLAHQLTQAGVRGVQREYRAVPGRRWRWDFAIPSHRLLVEVQGAVWKFGAHTSGVGVTRDCEKLSNAVALGWSQLSVTTSHVLKGEAISWITQAIQARQQTTTTTAQFVGGQETVTSRVGAFRVAVRARSYARRLSGKNPRRMRSVSSCATSRSG